MIIWSWKGLQSGDLCTFSKSSWISFQICIKRVIPHCYSIQKPYESFIRAIHRQNFRKLYQNHIKEFNLSLKDLVKKSCCNRPGSYIGIIFLKINLMNSSMELKSLHGKPFHEFSFNLSVKSCKIFHNQEIKQSYNSMT